MDRKLLTVLGCSSSLALSLLSTNSAQANNPTTEYIFTAPVTDSDVVKIPTRETDYPFFDCSCSEYDPAMIESIDRQGDQAIERFGCDCAGCRRLVQNLDDTSPIN